jgi:hypothetical protein
MQNCKQSLKLLCLALKKICTFTATSFLSSNDRQSNYQTNREIKNEDKKLTQREEQRAVV